MKNLTLMGLLLTGCQELDCHYDFLQIHNEELFACQEVSGRAALGRWSYLHKDHYDGETFCSMDNYCCYSLEKNSSCEMPLDMNGHDFYNAEDTNN